MGKMKYVGCRVIGCVEKHRSRGFCRKHYRQFTGECKKRYQKVKNDKVLSEVLRVAQEKYRKTEAYAKMKAKSDRRYYDKNKKKISEYRNSLRDKERFGGLRQRVLERDKNSCQMCFSTKSLVVHHKDGVGRNSIDPHNNIDNLVTLCRSCHMKVHAFR